MSVVDTGTVNERVFLDDNNDQARQSPLDLGAFPHECIGNVNLCPNGFTWAAWYKPQPANRQVLNLIAIPLPLRSLQILL